ncbi:hypothetical protein RsTz2092_02060 [Deferribacterales bacterium RsTz2092]|nr:hypothetical protein AGMMS49941_02340 [Deferribacterales bacterium]
MSNVNVTNDWLKSMARPEVLVASIYRSPRSESAPLVWLDANENPEKPYGENTNMLNRYPEHQPYALRRRLAEIYGVANNQILLTRGADEGIDLLIKTFCNAGRDSIALPTPTFVYYAMVAALYGVNVNKIPLKADFNLDTEQLLAADDTKLTFICTPNNPTGNVIPISEIEQLCAARRGKGLVVVDEAYIEFANTTSATTLLNRYENLIILRTLSKVYALAGARIGAIIASADIIQLLAGVIAPYPIPRPASDMALKALSPLGLLRARRQVEQLRSERDFIYEKLSNCPHFEVVYRSETNFIFAIAKDAEGLHQQLKSRGIMVRNMTTAYPSALRISIGLPLENKLLLAALDVDVGEIKLPRRYSDSRKTLETEIFCELTLDDRGIYDISTGVGFFDHMLEQFSKHSGISLIIQALGDTHVDAHHTIEDVAIALGAVLKGALGDKCGINRYGFATPMDESDANVTIDFSGRADFALNATFNMAMVGDFPTDMVEHFFKTLSDALGVAIHITATGKNAHHTIEAIFKCVARALRQAVAITNDTLPTTKGIL